MATHTHADHVGSHYEFDDCLVHRLRPRACSSRTRNTLIADDFDPGELRKLRIAGYEIEARIDHGAAPILATICTAIACDRRDRRRIVEEGDIVDTGDRRFEVLHLPGHSPGSIGLWEATTGILFSGRCHLRRTAAGRIAPF